MLELLLRGRIWIKLKARRFSAAKVEKIHFEIGQLVVAWDFLADASIQRVIVKSGV